jgi:hypothetical protein
MTASSHDKLPQKGTDPVDNSVTSNTDATSIIMEFLQDQNYFVAMSSVIFLEALTLRISYSQLIAVRDTFDHVVRAAVNLSSVETVKQHLAEAREHLRRSVVVAYQDAIELYFEQLDRRARFYPLRQLLFPDIVPLRDFRNRMNKATHYLTEARVLKGDWSSLNTTIELFRRSLDELQSLLEDSAPSRASFFIRILVFVISYLVFAVVGFLLLQWLRG